MIRGLSIKLVAICGLAFFLTGCTPFETVRNVQKYSDYNKKISELAVSVKPIGTVPHRILVSRDTGVTEITPELQKTLSDRMDMCSQFVADNARAVFANKLKQKGISVNSSSNMKLVLAPHSAETNCYADCAHRLWFDISLVVSGANGSTQTIWSGEFRYWFRSAGFDVELTQEQLNEFAETVITQMENSELL